MSLAITPIYAALLAVVLVGLVGRVVAARQQTGVLLGDGGDRDLCRRQRAHGNFAEHVPIALVLMTIAELQGAPGLVLHGLGVTLLGARLVHAAGISREPEPPALRTIGTAATLTVLGVAAGLVTLGSLGGGTFWRGA